MMPGNAFHPFPYDAFQQRAIEVIDSDTSLFVAAPTGSGKTVLADYVIETSFARRRKVIYTAPIKAISNQKFRDFTARHGEQVGILTGDVTINPHAPLLIMTTEIYRNTLLEDPERLAAYAWIIFDEIHFLDDVERGTVWEEAIMFTPPHINLLALSATIPNVEQIAEWIRQVHQRPVEVIVETHRTVPLSLRYQCQNRLFKQLPDLKMQGYHNLDDWRHVHHRRYGHRYQLHNNRLDTLVQELRHQDHLPGILFTFGRRRTEELAWELSGIPLLEPEEQRRLRALFDDLCDKFQLTQDRTAEALGRLIDRGVGYHHAGMLPTMKEVIERCFTSRLMKLIVTTETFALGVNMPARSVILDSLQKRSDDGFQTLRRREFLQMAGRAGRRGMDKEGFVYLRVNPTHISFTELTRLLNAKPEPVHSRFNSTYATLLNLYRRHGRALLDLFPRTLYYHQTTGARRQMGLQLMERKLDLLGSLGYLTPKGLTRKGDFGAWVYGYELLLTELHEHGHLSQLDPVRLAVLMTAIVYEPKPRMLAPKLQHRSKEMSELCKEPLLRIHKEERRCQITPLTKAPAFHLTQALEAWMTQAPFEKVSALCEVDEGEIVRYFRMAVQLLRQLAESPVSETTLRDNARATLHRINRGVVDAEAQLRLG
jgi:superfamily II RNA helicase